MQIEQVIGGVDGDTTAQAIQLRMRFPGERNLEFARIRAWDADGLNPVMLFDFTESLLPGPKGDTVLIVSESFIAHLEAGLAPDFTMTNLIPASYLAAGSLTFEGDDGTVYWSLSFGGAAYTGSTLGAAFNDTDGDFGPPVDGPLPTSDTRALLFQGEPLDLSTTNIDDYALTLGPAVFTNNAGKSAKVVPCPPTIDPIAGTDLRDFALLQNCLSETPGIITTCCEAADIDEDLTVDLFDYGLLFDDFVGP